MKGDVEDTEKLRSKYAKRSFRLQSPITKENGSNRQCENARKSNREQAS